MGTAAIAYTQPEWCEKPTGFWFASNNLGLGTRKCFCFLKGASLKKTSCSVKWQCRLKNCVPLSIECKAGLKTSILPWFVWMA